MNEQTENIRIELEFQRIISVLSGRPYGIECYNAQMKDIVKKNLDDINKKFTIVFPENIKLVSGSCLLGMFEDINNHIGIEGIKTRFEFEGCVKENLKKVLLDELKRSAC